MSAEQRSFWDSNWGRAPAGTVIPPKAPVRRSDPDTSKRAAASITSDDMALSEIEVLAALRQHGQMSDETLVEKVAALMSPSRARTARKELVERGLVQACGEAKTARGKPCIVWRIANA